MMKAAVIGASITACLVMAVLGGFASSSEAWAQRAAPHDAGANAGLLAFTATVGDNGHQITIIDPHERVMGVYWVDNEGKLALKSVRNIRWDLQMVDFNGVSPQSREVRSLVEQR
jgi:hypothetical protein